MAKVEGIFYKYRSKSASPKNCENDN